MKKGLIGLVCLSMLLSLAVPMIMMSSATASPGWWDSNWTERRSIIVGPHPENFQIRIDIPSDIPVSDYPSIRFLENEDSGVLPYWIEKDERSYTANLNVAWVRRLENSDSTIWMYYKNPSATSAENGDNVFLFFDDFGDSALNTSKWGSSGNWSVSSTCLNIWADGTVEHGPGQSIKYLDERRIIEFRMKNTTTRRGGMQLTGPSFGREAPMIFEKGGGEYRFWCQGFPGTQDGGYLSQQNHPGDVWYVLAMDLYGASNDKMKGHFYWGNDNADYRVLVEESNEHTEDWAPPDKCIDKYNLRAWEGSSSYYFDWFFVRRYAETEPSTEFYFIKECMPDLGQHSADWCWCAAAANSIYWWSQHGYLELIDDPNDPTENDNRYITDPLLPHPPPPPGCPGVYRLLHEIAVDCLFPGYQPESELTMENTYCEPMWFNDQYFYGLQEFIYEQGANLIVHEIVDNNTISPVPPLMDNIVIYRPPTLEDYQRELERCQDVLLWLQYRHYENEPPYYYEDTDHVVTGVGFSYDNKWILVSDPWTTGRPDHGNDLYHAPENEPYENLPVISAPDEPLWVFYDGVEVYVPKMIFISPEEEVEECGVEVTIEPTYQSGVPCTWLEYEVTVHNTGTIVDNYDLYVYDGSWPENSFKLDNYRFENIPPCENRTTTLHVHIPDNDDIAPYCMEKVIEVIAESEFCDAWDSEICIAHVDAECDVDVTIEPKHKRGAPCMTLTFVVRVHNTGDVPDNYLLSVVPDGWPMDHIYFESGLSTMLLENVKPCETENVLLYVHIPENHENATPCSHKEIVVVAESMFCDATDNDNALVQVVSKFLHNVIPGFEPLPPGDWLGTEWHEIYPTYCENYLLTSWEDNNLDGVVSPGDQIDITNLENQDIEWHYVKDVTCTLVLEMGIDDPPETWWYLEYENGWDNYCWAWWDPFYTQWNEIRPAFCNRYLLVDWIDSDFSGYLSWCDWVWLVDKATWEPLPFPLHVVEIVTDLVLCEKPAPVAPGAEVHLENGWNLVGFTAVGDNDTPNNIFTGLTYYTDYYIYRYQAPGGPYMLQGPDEVLKDNLGYWVWINRDNTVTTSGTPPLSRDIYLENGWNLVSFPVVNGSTTPNNIFTGLSYYTDYYLYWYQAPGGPYVLQGPDEVLKDNLGYWVWINRDNMVTVP